MTEQDAQTMIQLQQAANMYLSDSYTRYAQLQSYAAASFMGICLLIGLLIVLGLALVMVSAPRQGG